MALPVLRRSKSTAVVPEVIEPQPIPRVEPDQFQKAVAAVAEAFLGDSLQKSFLLGPGKTPGTPWSKTNLGNINTSLLARVSQNLASSFQRAPEEVELALAEHGLSWGPPFPPGRPLDPFWGYKRPPRTYDVPVGQNVQVTPRWGRISFGTLKAIIDSYYAAQICVRHLINDVRSLDYQFIPPANVLEDASDDIAKAEAFFEYPDRQQPFRVWLAEFLQDVLRYDAGSLYIRRNEGGDPIALEVVDGTTMIPLVDFFGRPPAEDTEKPEGMWPGETVPAFLQIIEGMPWVWLVKNELLYIRLNPLPESEYGLAPMEAVLLQANTDIRFQWHFLQYFTEGTIPAGFMEAPPDLSDPAQVAKWQEVWDAVMLGDQSKLNQVRWVPAGSRFTPVKNEKFDPLFPLYLMRCTAAAFGVTPNDLGFTEDVNRSTGEIQQDVQFRVGTLPVVRYVEDIINLFLREHLHLRARIQFDTGQGTQHRLEDSQADDILIKNGTISSDEARVKRGYRISKERPVPRIYDNSRSGPIPILAVQSLAGEIDPTTYGPAKDQPLLAHPFVAAPGVAPVIGSSSHKAAQDATANMQDNMLIQNADKRSPGVMQHADGTVQSNVKRPGQHELEHAPKEAADAKKAMLDAADMIVEAVLARLGVLKEGGSVDNTGGPGVTRGFSNPMTAGITVATGLEGVDLDEDDPMHEDHDDSVEKAYRSIRQWRENSLNRVKKGLSPRCFTDLPPFLREPIWARLEGTTTREEVLAAFSGDILAHPKAEARKGLSREVAGLAVQAGDTGRVLLIQRTPDHSDPDDAYARWEWPGGKLDGGDDEGADASVLAGAVREWQEETGATLPSSARVVGGWTSDDGRYEGFVVRVAHESDIELDPEPSETADARWWDPNDLDDPRLRDKVLEQLHDIRPALKSQWSDFHKHTDSHIGHFTPLMRAAMSQVLQADDITHAIRAAYGVRKATGPTAPGSQNQPNYQAQLAALAGAAPAAAAPVAAMGGAAAGAAGLGIAAGSAVLSSTAAALGIGGAIALLLAARRNVKPLKEVLGRLYGTAASEGAGEAQDAVQRASSPLAELTAQHLESGEMRRVLDRLDIVLRGIADTEVDRIGNAIADGVRAGRSMDEVVSSVQDIVNDAKRAALIAETEYLRAYAAAQMDTYRSNHVGHLVWIAQPGACERCLENEAASPIAIGDSWPNGPLPVHPNERCAVAPA